MVIKPHPKFKGIFIDTANRKKLYTKNLVPGQSVYGEKLIKDPKYGELREWIVSRSKLAAAIVKGIKEVPLKEGDYVLYLGIAAGTTASHVSDIIGWDGIIYGVDVAPRVLMELIPIVEKRKNIIPILADANKPETYEHIVTAVDFVYQDVAQPNQVEIFIKNIDMFLKPNGYGMIAVKSRSIDVTKDPRIVFKEVEKQLQEHGLKIVDMVRIDPYHKDHAVFLVKK